MSAGQKRLWGFTLLELIVAVTVLAVFLLPMMLLVSRAKDRAIQYTIEREVRDLAQRKLFDRIHYYEEADTGDFSHEGHPEWSWHIAPPEMVGTTAQTLLEYTIEVSLPQKLKGGSGAAGDPSSDGSIREGGSTYRLSLWAFPDERWYEEQDFLYQHGSPSTLYGTPGVNY